MYGHVDSNFEFPAGKVQQNSKKFPLKSENDQEIDFFKGECLPQKISYGPLESSSEIAANFFPRNGKIFSHNVGYCWRKDRSFFLFFYVWTIRMDL